jgi:hypothetical protein
VHLQKRTAVAGRTFAIGLLKINKHIKNHSVIALILLLKTHLVNGMIVSPA